MERFITFLLYLWQLPQCLVGLLLSFYYKGNVHAREVTRHFSPDVYRSTKMNGGISLGYYVIINQFASLQTLKHELGHCKQSLYLGWLYLIVIGLPSLAWAIIHSNFKSVRDKHDYYWFYTERWANRLGGVE